MDPRLMLILILVAAVVYREYWLFIRTQNRLRQQYQTGDQAGAIAGMERLVRSFSVGGRGIKASAHYALADMYRQENRTEDAVHHLRAAVDGFKALGSVSLVAEGHRMLASSLETLGDADGAAEHRRLAENLIGTGKGDVVALTTRARMLAEQGRHGESLEAYEAMLAACSPRQKSERIDALLHLALEAQQCNRLDDMQRWSEEALALEPPSPMRILAHRLAALAASAQGRAAEAETHLDAALEMARRSGGSLPLAECLSQKSQLLCRRGALEEALSLCREALQVDKRVGTRVHINEAITLMVMGRMEEARAALDAMRAAYPLPDQSERAISLALADLAQSQIEAETGHPDLALALLKKAMPPLRHTERVRGNMLGTQAWILALLGCEEETVRAEAEAEAWAACFPNDREENLEVNGFLARMALAQGNFARCRECVHRCLPYNPTPVEVPSYHFWLGEASLGEGDRETARREYEQAVSLGFDTHYARRAQQRLCEMGQATS